MSKSVSTVLRDLFSEKCELCNDCYAYREDSWYCIVDHGDHCGIAKEARRQNNKDNYDYVSLEMLFEEPKSKTAPFLKE